jgi:acyl-coenzyme A thioesterase PaaI-like protein
VWRSFAPSEVRSAVAADVARIATRLGPFEAQAPVRTPIGGALPGRGHPLLPPMVHRRDGDRWRGTVRYTAAHAGAGEAVHGGQVTLLFDEVLGAVAGSVRLCRTASLTVNYRSLTPVGIELTFEGWVDRVEGRKIHVAGSLRDGDRVCAEAVALFLGVEDWG